MLLFDAENNEDKAFHFFDTLLSKNADVKLRNNFMQCFYDLQKDYDLSKGIAELSLPNKS